MNTRQLIALLLSICGTAFGCVWLHAQLNRYSMIQSGERAYRLDRRTGDIWLVSGSSYGPVTGPVSWAD
ncbi:MAG: hypothetical protein AAGG48_15485 [Planctomycetota bacterium]